MADAQVTALESKIRRKPGRAAAALFNAVVIAGGVSVAKAGPLGSVLVRMVPEHDLFPIYA